MTNWSDVVRKYVASKPISTEELGNLPGYCNGDEEPIDLLYQLARIVARVDDHIPEDAWVGVAGELKQQIAAGPLEDAWNYVAWSMGVMGDFACRLGLVDGAK